MFKVIPSVALIVKHVPDGFSLGVRLELPARAIGRCIVASYEERQLLGSSFAYWRHVSSAVGGERAGFINVQLTLIWPRQIGVGPCSLERKISLIWILVEGKAALKLLS